MKKKHLCDKCHKVFESKGDFDGVSDGHFDDFCFTRYSGCAMPHFPGRKIEIKLCGSCREELLKFLRDKWGLAIEYDHWEVTPAVTFCQEGDGTWRELP